ncbi:MAG: CHAD domain-containing protein [Myxococcota bacterium]|jgi:CHAD domain-containing protein
MSFTIALSVESGVEIQRLLVEQLDEAIVALEDSDRESGVHTARKACKRGRGVLLLARSGLGRRYTVLQHGFRDAARLLGPIRDGDVMQQTAQLAGASAPPRVGEEDGQHRIASARAMLAAQREALAEAPVSASRKDLIRGAVRGYKRACAGLRAVEKAAEAERLHEWRKAVKHHFYHLQLLHDLFPPVFLALATEADGLQELLGSHHDLSVLRALLTDEVAIAALAAREEAMAVQALGVGEVLFALPARSLRVWLVQLWGLRARSLRT